VAKRLERPVEEKLKYLHVRHPTVEEIVGVLSEAGPVTLRTSTHEYQDLKDYVENCNDQHPEMLEIASKMPQVVVSLRESGVNVRAQDSDTVSMGLVAKVTEALQQADRPVARTFLGTFNLSLVLLLIGGFFYAWGNMFDGMSSWFVLGPILLGGLWFFIVGVRADKANTILEAPRFVGGSGFLIRNRDQLLVGIVSSLLGAILGYFARNPP
jgi:hypothetical protein